MRIIEQLVYKITGDNLEFDKSLDTSERNVDKFGKVANKIFAGVTVTAIAMAVKKLGELAISSATALDRVDKMSQKIGLSREAFQEWDYVLGQSGASVEGLQMGLKTLSSAADEAQKGTLQYKESFDRLGVSVTDVNGQMKDQETLFNEVFFALAGLENQTERTAIASDLLGRSATELSPALNTNREDLEALKVQAHDLGLVYKDELIDAGVVLGDNIDALTKSFGAFKTRALAPIIGFMVTVTDKMLGQEHITSELEKATGDLKTQSMMYKSTLSQLLDPTVKLTEVERARLLVLSQTQAQTLESTLLATATAYEKDAKSINESTLRLEERKIEEAAFAMVALDRADKTELASKRLDELEERERRNIITTREQVELGRLREALSLDGADFLNRYAEIMANTNDAQKELNDLTESYNVALKDFAVLVKEDIVNIDKYAVSNKNFYNSVMSIVEELDLEEQALKKAKEGYEEFKNASSDVVDGQIKLLQEHGKTREAQLLLGMLLDLQNQRLAKAAVLTSAVTEKEDLRNQIIQNTNDALTQTDALEEVLGEQYDQNSEKISIITNALKSLIESGLDPTDERVVSLQSQLSSLVGVVDESNEISKAYNASLKTLGNELLVTGNQQSFWENVVSLTEQTMVELLNVTDANSTAYQQLANSLAIAKSELAKFNQEANRPDYLTSLNARKKALADWQQGRADAYKEIESYRKTDYEKEMEAIDEKAKAFRLSGVDEVTIAQWVADRKKEIDDGIVAQAERRGAELLAIAQSDADKAEEEAERAKKAWEDYAFGVAGSITSMWDSINKVREHANAKELQDLERLHAERLEDAKEAGASEQELADLSEELQTQLNDKKTELAKEDAKRQRQLAIFQVAMDTAKAIMQIWADPTAGGVIGKSIWTGIASGAGIAQIAAINAQPEPSFDVGSIRVPETTRAIVHKDEMILTAPQAEQARREGITISPSGGGGGNYTFMIYLDGKQISDATVKNINSGMYKIDARVVK